VAGKKAFLCEIFSERDGARTRNHRIDSPVKNVFFASKMRIRGQQSTPKCMETQGKLCRDTGSFTMSMDYSSASPAGWWMIGR
jgi:hypothetical protein